MSYAKRDYQEARRMALTVFLFVEALVDERLRMRGEDFFHLRCAPGDANAREKVGGREAAASRALCAHRQRSAIKHTVEKVGQVRRMVQRDGGRRFRNSQSNSITEEPHRDLGSRGQRGDSHSDRLMAPLDLREAGAKSHHQTPLVRVLRHIATLAAEPSAQVVRG